MDSLTNGPQPTDGGNVPNPIDQRDGGSTDSKSAPDIAKPSPIGIGPNGKDQSSVEVELNTPIGTPCEIDGAEDQKSKVESELTEDAPSENEQPTPSLLRNKSRGKNRPVDASDSDREGKPSQRKKKSKQRKVSQFVVAKDSPKSVFVSQMKYIAGPEKPKSGKERLRLTDVTSELYSRQVRLPVFLEREVDSHLSALMTERLVFVSSVDEHIAHDAAYAVVQRITLPNKGPRLLNFAAQSQTPEEPFNIYSLIGCKGIEPESPTVLLADAVPESATCFVDSLMSATTSASSSIKDSLTKLDLYVVCILDWIRVTEDIPHRDRNFLCWKVPFLRPLLARHFSSTYEELVTRLLEQRKLLKWDADEIRFYQQIKTYIGTDQLAAELDRRDGSGRGYPIASMPAALGSARQYAQSDTGDGGSGTSQPEPGTNSLKDIALGTSPLNDIALYVAVYFSGLSPAEFSRIVMLLADNQSMTVTATRYKETKKGKLKPIEERVQRPLGEVWREDADRILESCSLGTAVLKGAIKTVGFSDPVERERAKRGFDSQRGLYLDNQFRKVIECELLFDSSDLIAEGVIQLITTTMVSTSPRSGQDLLLDLILRLTPSLNSEGIGLRNRPQRIAQLIRAMLKHEQLAALIRPALEQLMGDPESQTKLLATAKHLRFAKGFDEFYWLKQLLDRGCEEVRTETHSYVSSCLKGMGPAFYEVLIGIEAWLPETERDQSSYSISNRSALKAALEFCVDATIGFDAVSYGTWPSRSPLFAATDPIVVERNWTLLARWLVHPGMPRVAREVVEGDFSHFLASLIAEWVFILLGPDRQEPALPSAPLPWKPGKMVSIQTVETRVSGAPDTLRLLVKNVMSAATEDLRRLLLNEWEYMKAFIADILDMGFYESHREREELIWKRNRVRELIALSRSAGAYDIGQQE